MKMRLGDRDGLVELIKDLPDNITMAEIGCFAGESAELFLKYKRIKTFYAIDPWSTEYNPYYGGRQPNQYKYGKLDSNSLNNLSKAEWVYSNMPQAEKLFDERTKGFNVVKLKMTMAEAFSRLPDGLDFVYIDGDHNYECVKTDILLAAQKIRHGGIIAGHDYKEKYQEGVIKAVDQIFGVPHKTYRDSSWLVNL